MKDNFLRLLKSFEYHSTTDWLCSLAPSAKYNLTVVGAGLSIAATIVDKVFGLSGAAFLGFLVIMFFELFSGIAASVLVKKENFTSRRISRFSFKCTCYLVLISVPYVFSQSFKAHDSNIAGAVCEWLHIFFTIHILVENLTSILENMAVISGKDKTHWISKIQTKLNSLFP